MGQQEEEVAPLTGVSKTAILTLRARADEQREDEPFLEDPFATRWLEVLGWPKELDTWYARDVQILIAARADEFDRMLAGHVERHSAARTTVVELGAGLSSRYLRMGEDLRWFDLDLPEVVATRRTLGVEGPNHTHLDLSVLDRSWIDALTDVDRKGLFILAEGLFYYLPRADVDALLWDLRARLPGATIAFDLLGRADFATGLARSSSIGTPFQWMIEPPFIEAPDRLGLEELPGLDTHTRLVAYIEQYWGRFGRTQQMMASFATKHPHLVSDRSGTVLGKLRPLPK